MNSRGSIHMVAKVQVYVTCPEWKKILLFSLNTEIKARVWFITLTCSCIAATSSI